MSEFTDQSTFDSEQKTSNLMIEKQVCFSLYSATNAIIRAYRPLLKGLDLTYPQYLVMMVLWQSDGINVKALGCKLHLDSGTLTPLLKRLENKALLTRSRGKQDERVRDIFLTESGKALKANAESIPSALFCKADLPIDELRNLKASCEKLVTNFDK